MPDSVLCGNDAHGPRRAHFRVTFPNNRFNSERVCLACARNLVAWAAGVDCSIYFEAVNAT